MFASAAVLSKSYHPPHRRVMAQSPACSLGFSYVAAHNSSVYHFLISSARRTHLTVSLSLLACRRVLEQHMKRLNGRTHSTMHDENNLFLLTVSVSHLHVKPRALPCNTVQCHHRAQPSGSPINVRSAAESVDHHNGPTRKLAMKDRAVGARPNGGASGRTERPVKLGRPQGEA
jgi:hypothetical protein